MEQKNRFGEFIAKLRKEKQISLEQLSDGICAISMLSRFERGEREPEKLLQNRILTRLGAVPENYENFLYYNEYCRWEKRQGILHNILEENFPEAKRLLEEYRQEYDMEYSLEQQFYLAILAQIRRHEGCRKEELADIFERALELTVPEADKRSFRNRVLSLEEMNLLLEYRHCKEENVSLHFYENLLEYIEGMERTMLAMAKIYPKTVYYYYEAWKQEGKDRCSAEHMLMLCDKAIELLRNANRMFYLWELFCMKEELAPMLPKRHRQEEAFRRGLEECRGWRETLEELYADYGVSIAMYEFCYLYVESENYCIGDVVRIRRKMLGLSQEKLSEGICDSRTVSRLERHLRKPQREIVQQLFDRLNLSTELCRTELVTDSQEAIEKYRELRVLNNVKNYEQVAIKLEELKSLISTEIPSNRQALLRKEVISQYDYGMMSKEEYVGRMKEVLECTIPYEKALMLGERYLTNEELYCIQNMTLKMDWSFAEMRECVDSLIDYCEKPVYPGNYLRMYQFIMAAVASYLGNIGEYERSSVIDKKILKLLLKNRRMGGIHEALYTLMWNKKQECNISGKCMYQEMDNSLQKCIQIGHLIKDLSRLRNYLEKQDENEFSQKLN